MESRNGWTGVKSNAQMYVCVSGVSAVFVNFGFLSHALMSKSFCFDFARARGDTGTVREKKIQNYF